MIHRERTHPQFVEGCYGCKISTVSMHGPATEGRKQISRKFSRDLDAYKAAKKSGLQPEMSTTEGVEKAERQAEVEDRVKTVFGVKDIKEIEPDRKLLNGGS